MTIRHQEATNYKENMRAFLWQEHFFKYDKNKNIFIFGVVIDNFPYFKEIEINNLAEKIQQDILNSYLDYLIDELSEEVIKNKQLFETEEYKKWLATKNQETNGK